MKKVMMAAAAMFVAGSMAAQSVTEVCCLQVYDFKASIKNSNIGVKLDKTCQKNYAYKFIENNTLTGYLVVSCSQCCTDGKGMGELYVYRASDKTKSLYKVPSDLVFADVFVSGVDPKKDCTPVIGTDAEGLLWINPDFWNWSNTMEGFFGSFDTGVTTFIATGFGKAVTTKDQWILGDGECEPTLIPGCTTLDSLSGSIVGAMNYSSVCNEPYQLICTGDNQFVDEVVSTVNAVATGTWSIKRSSDKRIIACDLQTIEENILAKLPKYSLVDNAD